MYPGWSARDNYAVHKKRRKRKAKSEKGNDEGMDSITNYDSQGFMQRGRAMQAWDSPGMMS